MTVTFVKQLSVHLCNITTAKNVFTISGGNDRFAINDSYVDVQWAGVKVCQKLSLGIQGSIAETPCVVDVHIPGGHSRSHTIFCLKHSILKF